jgi:uncharacterized repeat protein (TIGR04076 family)
MKVKIKVISQQGTCTTGHKVGDEFIFSEDGIEGKICIHALYSILPKVYAMMYGAKFPWVKEGQKPTHACPDAKNPLVFELKKID